MHTSSFLAPLIVLSCWSTAVLANSAIVLAPQFADNMVVQRNQRVPIYGSATAGATLRLQFDGETESAKVDAEGNWSATFPALPAGGPFTLNIDGDGALTLQNILVGDVWLASGQSNMEMPLATTFGSGPGILNAATEIAAAEHPNIRFFRQKRSNSVTPLTRANGAWQLCTPATVINCSAIAYYFAADLESREHIPIGLICTYAGGTPIEAWTPPDALAKAPGYPTFLKRWQAAVASYPVQKADYDKKVAAQKAAVEEARKSGAPIPPYYYISPPRGSPERAPGALYNAMIAPFITIPITGIIWYQGEDNVNFSTEYRGFFSAMITSWRAAWRRDDLPFLFVQLSGLHAPAPQPGPSNWAELREAQTTALQLPNTGMAVSFDLGDAANVHYVNKKPVGIRLAKAARALVYKEPIEGSSPLYESMSLEGDAVRIKFSHAPMGLKTSNGGPVQGFTLAGDDHVFVPADATVDGSSVIVRSGQVAKPVAVRYAWADNPVANLVSADDMPVSPFRTDTFEH